MTLETCLCCGSISTVDATVRLDSLRGNEHVKRALEVAAVGNHSVVLMACRQNMPSAERFALWLRSQFGNYVQVAEPCFCGYHGDVYHTCTCSVRAIERYQRRLCRATNNVAVYIELADVPAEKMLSTRKPEADETIIARVRAAQQRQKPSTDLDNASMRLMQAAIRQLVLNEQQVQQMIEVAQSVTQLAGETVIKPAHLAEALQYRVR